MTLTEFKAWFEGFTEDMDGAPSEKQWERIKSRVGEVNGAPVTERVYVDRYYPTIWNGIPRWGSLVGSSGQAVADQKAYAQALNMTMPAEPFDSGRALYATGKADAAELKAA